jgi:hypothetical protein
MVHVRSKRWIRLFGVCSVLMMAALAFNLFAVSGASAQVTHPVNHPTSQGPHPRFVEFHHSWPETVLASSSLKTWTSSFTSEGKTWTYTMVGTNPSKGSKTTTVPVTIIPLKMVFSNGDTFNGHKVVSQTTSSPLFQNASFISGNTQYGDAILRAAFWNHVQKSSPNWHVLVGKPTIAPTVTMNIPAADGATATDPSTGDTIGLVDINWLDPEIQTMLTSYKPTMFPIFLSDMVYATQGAPNLNDCCIGGYHNAVTNSNGLQTYAWSTEVNQGVEGGFSEDVSALSHEMNEWFNDPFTNNIVPNWISPIAPQYGCNNYLEVGDPLVGVLFTVSGFSSDHLQDIVLFPWFARESPSKAINGLYTYLGTFTALSTKC